MKKRHLLFVIFALTLGTRLFIAFSTPHFSDPDAYFVLRQVDNIKETGLPLYEDPLSYGGRNFIFLPLFHYILAFFSLFFSTILVAKVVPNLFATSLVVIVYLSVIHLTKSKNIALFTAFASGFIPIYFIKTVNSVSVYSMVIPLSFLMFYLCLRLRTKKGPYYFLAALALFLILSPYSILISLAMVLYIILVWVENLKPTRSEVELTMFSLFLVVWFYILIFKQALLQHGVKIIWQNIPSEVIRQYFADITLTGTINSVGIVPLLTGIFVFNYYIFRKKKKGIYLFLCLALLIVMLLLQKYIIFYVGLIYIGVIMTIMFGDFLNLTLEYLEKTKVKWLGVVLIFGFTVIFIFTSVIPSIGGSVKNIEKNDPTAEILGLELLDEISGPSVTITGSVFDGHLITYFAKRKNILDSNFLLVNANQRIQDLRTVYTSAIQARPNQLMNRYSSDYLMVTHRTREYYNISKLTYVDDSCFKMIYTRKDVEIYQRKC